MVDETPNAAYFAKYDGLLSRWPVEVEPLDLRGRYGTTHVNACGPPGAPTIVLMHGGRATSTVWYGIVGALAHGFRVYAIDAIGDAGRSVDDGEPLVGRAGLMSWLDETLDLLGVDSTAIVGHSFGAWMSMQYALHAPGSDRPGSLCSIRPIACRPRRWATSCGRSHCSSVGRRIGGGDSFSGRHRGIRSTRSSSICGPRRSTSLGTAARS